MKNGLFGDRCWVCATRRPARSSPGAAIPDAAGCRFAQRRRRARHRASFRPHLPWHGSRNRRRTLGLDATAGQIGRRRRRGCRRGGGLHPMQPSEHQRRRRIGHASRPFVDAMPLLLLTTARLQPDHCCIPGEMGRARFPPDLLIEADGDGWLEDTWCGSTVHLGPSVACCHGKVALAARWSPGRNRSSSADVDIFETIARHHDATFGVWAARAVRRDGLGRRPGDGRQRQLTTSALVAVASRLASVDGVSPQWQLPRGSRHEGCPLKRSRCRQSRAPRRRRRPPRRPVRRRSSASETHSGEEPARRQRRSSANEGTPPPRNAAKYQ